LYTAAGLSNLLSKILCPISFDENSIAALELARDLAIANAAKLYLLHVAAIPPADMDSPVPIAQHPRWEREAKVKLEQIGHERLAGKLPYEVLVESGIAEDVVTRVAREIDVDLIVMATHARRGLKRLVLGSVAEAIAHEATCAVLTLKPAVAANAP
jgi:nucleotide-binding universal stress UspA family protein